jgi:phage-related minor tail protein
MSLGEERFIAFEKPAKTAQEIFEQMMGAIKDAPDILEATSLASELFGSRVGAKVAEDIRAGRFEVDEFVKALQNVDGTMQRTADESLTMTERFAMLRNEIAVALVPIAERLMDALEKIVEKIQPVIERVSAWISENEELATKIFAGVLAISGLVAIIGTLGLILPSIIAGFKLVVAVFSLVGLVVAGIILVIGLFIAIGWRLYHDWDLIIEGLKLYIQDFLNFWRGIWDSVYEYFEDTWDGIKIIFDEAIEWIMKKMRPLLNAVDRVKEVGSGLLSKASSGISAIREAMPFANGGIVTRPTLGLVGEAGPEAIIPLSKAGMMGGITINITGGYYLSEMASEDIGNKIIEKLKKTMKL